MVWDSCPLASCSFTLLLLRSRSSGCFCQSLENAIKHLSFTSLWSQKAPWCRVLGPHKRRHNQEPLKTPIWQIIKYWNSVFQLIKILKFRVFRIFRISGWSAPPPTRRKCNLSKILKFRILILSWWFGDYLKSLLIHSQWFGNMGGPGGQRGGSVGLVLGMYPHLWWISESHCPNLGNHVVLQTIIVGYVGPCWWVALASSLATGIPLHWELGIDIAPAIASDEEDAQNIPIKWTITSKKHAFHIYPSPLYACTFSQIGPRNAI